MDPRKTIAAYSLTVGAMMMVMWTVFAVTDQIPELDDRPTEIAFHLAAEFATALTLVAGGLGLLARREWGFAVNSTGLGMLAYTVIVSPGYYAETGDYAFVGMFGVLMVLTFLFIAVSVWKRADLQQR